MIRTPDGKKVTVFSLKNGNRPSTVVFDKGRRGNPLPGCDCVQCFGYCLVKGSEEPRGATYGERNG